MKFLRYALALMALFAFNNAAFADDKHDHEEEELNDRDYPIVRNYLAEKRAEDEAGLSKPVSISGDIRTEWRHLTESSRGHQWRGGDATNCSGRPISKNDFDLEFNLYFNYTTEKTWAEAQLRYDNTAGVDDTEKSCSGSSTYKRGCNPADPTGWHGSGSCDDICLKKAYMGMNVWSCGVNRFDVELGRRGNLYNVFDSNVQFLARLDGIILKYSTGLECIADWYIKAAGFVVDEKVNHFAWAAETGFLNIMDYGFDVKYSFIDWRKNGKNRCFVRNPRGMKYMNSQVTFIYHLTPEYITSPVKLYAAGVYNHDAQKFTSVQFPRLNIHSKQNLAWYAGVLIGEVEGAGDWALEVQYQYVETLSIPDYDMSGIGRGNLRDSTITADGMGDTNFKGFRIEFLYALTNDISLDTIIEWSRAIDKRIGGAHNFSKFELEAIYSF